MTEPDFEIKEQNFEIGELEERDIENLLPVVREWVKDRDTGIVSEEEVSSIKERISNSLTGDGYKYFVVRDDNGIAIGCAGVREPDDIMKEYKSSPVKKSTELVNVFLSNKYRGMDLGKKLLEYTFQKAKEKGYEEILWNSGPRYKDSAWGFYNKLVGNPVAIIKDLYGKDGDAPVWRKELN